MCNVKLYGMISILMNIHNNNYTFYFAPTLVGRISLCERAFLNYFFVDLIYEKKIHRAWRNCEKKMRMRMHKHLDKHAKEHK